MYHKPDQRDKPLTPVLSSENISVLLGPKNNKRTVLRGVSIEIKAGEVVGLIGPNGAGKSTLMSVLAGDHAPDEGRVILAGKTYQQWGERQAAQHRSVMLQDTSVSYGFSVREVIHMGRAAWPRDPDKDDRMVQRALEQVDMLPFADRDVTTLSGGERARAALARVIAQDAEVVMLDEPTAAMDIGYSERTLLRVRTLAAQGKGVLIVIHDLATAARHCDRLVLLSEGKVYAQGTPREVITSENLSHVYGWPIRVSFTEEGPWIRPVSIDNSDHAHYHTHYAAYSGTNRKEHHMETHSLSHQLKEATAVAHERAEGSDFIVNLMSGKLPKDAFISLQEQAFLFYTALENALDSLAEDPQVAKIADRRLDRAQILREDLHALGGSTSPEPLTATADYVAQLEDIAARGDGPALIAHHYVRYLGDLSGGQVIASKMKSLLGIEPEALGFYKFDEIGKIKPYKDQYRAAIDTLELNEKEQERMLQAAEEAFLLNQRVFQDLGAVHPAQAES